MRETKVATSSGGGGCKLHNMICICHRVYLSIYVYPVYRVGERERKIHFILDTIYLFRARFGVYPLNRRCMGRGMI